MICEALFDENIQILEFSLDFTFFHACDSISFQSVVSGMTPLSNLHPEVENQRNHIILDRALEDRQSFFKKPLFKEESSLCTKHRF